MHTLETKYAYNRARIKNKIQTNEHNTILVTHKHDKKFRTTKFEDKCVKPSNLKLLNE